MVTATVTDHGISYDDEGNDDYTSSVSYEVNGVRYKDKHYETVNNKKALTPIGTKVQLEVSPEDPGILISTLKNSYAALLFGIVSFSLLLTFEWKLILFRMRSADLLHAPDAETIQKDANLTVSGRFAPLFFLSLSVFGGLLLWRYSPLIPDWVDIVVLVCAAIGLWRLLVLVRDIRIVKNTDYEVRRDVLISKEITTSDDGDTYNLTYRSKDGTWSTTTSERNYNSIKKGDTIVAVYLPGKNHPLIHYDLEGDVC